MEFSIDMAGVPAGTCFATGCYESAARAVLVEVEGGARFRFDLCADHAVGLGVAA